MCFTVLDPREMDSKTLEEYKRSVGADWLYHFLFYQCGDCKELFGALLSTVSRQIKKKGLFKAPKMCMHCWADKRTR